MRATGKQVKRWAMVAAIAGLGTWRVVSVGGSVGAAASSSAGCGGGIECGNGVQEDGEECDDGNANEADFCRACVVYNAPRTTITWDFNKYPDRGFSGDSCTDTGVATVNVDITGPSGPLSMADQCTKRQVVFFDLNPGAYTVSVTPLDANGNSKVKAPVQVQVMAQRANIQADVNIPFDAWSSPYTGLFLFRLAWATKTCSQATPPVVTQTMKLLVGGQPVATLTDTGQKVDGIDGKPCREIAEARPQGVADLPFGPATIEVTGKDSVGVEKFKKTFDTFVGIGQVNPTLQFDVPALPDAPPDAPPDAM